MLTDQEAFDALKQVAEGRNPLQMGALVHVAHEAVTLASERDKHGALLGRRSASLARNGAVLGANGQAQFDAGHWDDLKAHLTDGEGSSHVDVILGLVWAALAQQDQVEFETQLYLLVKAADLTFPHVRQAIQGL